MSDIHNTENISILQNARYEVLTTDGYKPFKGLASGHTDDLYTYYGNTYTGGHTLIADSTWQEVRFQKEAVKLNLGITKVYDFIDIKDTNSYLNNDLIHHNCLILDEFAFVDNTKKFMKAAFPVISSATNKKNSKIIILSTPNGMNDFYQIWRKAKSGANDFQWYKIDWRDVPRGVSAEEFKQQEIGKSDTVTFEQEYGCTSPETTVTVKTPTGEVKDVTINELRLLLQNDK